MRDYHNQRCIRKKTLGAITDQPPVYWAYFCGGSSTDHSESFVAEFNATVMCDWMGETHLHDYYQNVRLTYRGRIISPVYLPFPVKAAIRAEALRRLCGRRAA